MSLNHRPARTRPTADRLHEHFQERLERGGQPLADRRSDALLPRPRRRRGAKVRDLVRRILRDAALGTLLGLASAAVVVGPVAYGMGWL